MRKDEIKVGRCYESWTGSIRKVTKIHHRFAAGTYVEAESRKPGDAPGKWPGSNGAYLDVFAGNSVGEVPCEEEV